MMSDIVFTWFLQIAELVFLAIIGWVLISIEHEIKKK